MKNIKKIVCLMLVLVLALCMGISAFSKAVPETTTTYAGSTVTVAFEYEGVKGVNGTFSFDNEALFESIDITATGLNGDPAYGDGNYKVACYGDEVGTCTIALELKVADSAVDGDQCIITFTYEATEDGQLPTDPETQTDTAIVKIVDEPASTTTTTTTTTPDTPSTTPVTTPDSTPVTTPDTTPVTTPDVTTPSTTTAATTAPAENPNTGTGDAAIFSVALLVAFATLVGLLISKKSPARK